MPFACGNWPLTKLQGLFRLIIKASTSDVILVFLRLMEVDEGANTAKLAAAIMAACTRLRSHYLHGYKFGEAGKDGPFANPARIQEISETARRNNLQTT
jgi:hypothetical protein